MVFPHNEPPIRRSSINHSAAMQWWRWIDGSEPLVSAIPPLVHQISWLTEACMPKDKTSVRWVSLLITRQFSKNWDLIQRKIGYPGIPFKNQFGEPHVVLLSHDQVNASGVSYH